MDFEGGETRKPPTSNEVPADDLPEGLAASNEVPQDDLPPEALAASSSKEVPQDDLPDGVKRPDEETGYMELPRTVGAGLEGAAKGIGGPLATAAELGLSRLGVPGMSAEDQNKRKEDYPIIEGMGEVGGMLSPIGEIALLGKIIPEVTTVSKLGKIGSAAFKNFLAGAAIQGGNEASEYLTHQDDPQTSVPGALIHMGAAGLLNGAVGGVTQGANAGLRALENAKAGTNMKEFLVGMGAAAKGAPLSENAPEWVSDWIKRGHEFYNKGMGRVIGKIGGAGATAGTALAEWLHSGNLGRATSEAGAVNLFLKNTIEKFVGKAVTPAAKKAAEYVIPKMLSSGETSGLFDVLDHAANVNRGLSQANAAVGNLFKAGSISAVDAYATDRDREKIKEHLEDGGVSAQMQDDLNQQSWQGYAKGGPVIPVASPDPIATHFPDQAMMLGMAKGRVSNYLNSLRPQVKPAKLPFDADPHQGDQEKKFKRAIDIAAKPLSILNKVKDGSLTTEEMGHFHQLFPEIHTHLSKQITKKIIEQQIKGECPPYKTRQGLSTFLGAALDSSFNPANIQAAQAVFADKRNQAAAQGANKPKRGTSKLGEVSKQFRTSEQARDERQVSEK